MLRSCKRRKIWAKRRPSYQKGICVVGIFSLLGMGVNFYYSDGFKKQREEMVLHQLIPRGIEDSNILKAMRKVPRHLFVPTQLATVAYADYPISIGYQQTISQPYIIALTIQQGKLTPRSKVLEIGTGSGYQTAILADLCQEVYSIEIIKPLFEKAQKVLKQLGYANIHFRRSDGWLGWPEKAPFDVIVVSAASAKVPPLLLAQLKEEGRLIIPIGGPSSQQYLMCYQKKGGKILEEKLAPVNFVPFTRAKSEKNLRQSF
jgi:protein-L-isoaspartate(D-aspartate) O-methyltransferase